MSNGIVLVLLSPESVSREESIQWFEVHYALSRSANFAPGRPTVFPVVLRDFKKTMGRLHPALQTIAALDLSHVQPRDRPAAVLAELTRVTTIIDA